MAISSLIPPNNADFTAFLVETSFTHSCVSRVNLFETKPIFFLVIYEYSPFCLTQPDVHTAAILATSKHSAPKTKTQTLSTQHWVLASQQTTSPRGVSKYTYYIYIYIWPGNPMYFPAE